MYPHIELTLFLYLVLNGPGVRGFIGGSLNLVWTVLERLYIVAFRGFLCSILYKATFCVPYSWLRTTFNIHTKVVEELFLYLLPLWITYLFTSNWRILVPMYILLLIYPLVS